MDFLQLLVLGLITGGTIFLGMPLARMKSVSESTKAKLMAASVGILLFLLVDVLTEAMDATKTPILAFFGGTGPFLDAALHLGLFILGLVLGLLGLVWYEQHFLKVPKNVPDQNPAFLKQRARQLALMIAAGIGFHNFSEGLAIGQSYASGSISLALLLVIGFALHNATEGFGIAGPLSGTKPSWKFLGVLGLIGGGPTFVGTLIGSLWSSTLASVLFFALAAGAIIYVIKEILYHGRTHGEGLGQMGFVLIGFLIGFLTDVLVVYASGG